MLTVRTLQEGICALLKSRPLPVELPELTALATSPGIDMAREIVYWWRAFQLEQICPLTSMWLQRHGSFNARVIEFYESVSVSSFIEELGPEFAGFIAQHPADPIAAALAVFEQALLAVRRGTATVEVETIWPCDPYPIIKALLHGLAFEAGQKEGVYYSIVGPEYPGGFIVVQH